MNKKPSWKEKVYTMCPVQTVYHEPVLTGTGANTRSHECDGCTQECVRRTSVKTPCLMK
jgi:hypothetical protein